MERLIREQIGDGDGGADEGEIPEGLECIDDDDCEEGQACFEGICVGTGKLRFSLSWTAATDFDLHLQAPDGTTIDFANPHNAWADLDVDDCVDGECLNPDMPHVENIFLTDGAPRGTYSVFVNNFNGGAEGEYTIEVAGDVSAVFTGVVPAVELASGPVHEVDW